MNTPEPVKRTKNPYIGRQPPISEEQRNHLFATDETIEREIKAWIVLGRQIRDSRKQVCRRSTDETKIAKSQAMQLYKDGLPLKQIANETGLTVAMIATAANRAGLRRRGFRRDKTTE